MQLKTGMVVLGLATSHCRKLTKQKLNWQVRWVDQTQYPMIVVASLSAVPQSCRTPLHEKLKFMNHNKTTQIPRRSFTSVQMVHTHAPLPRGFFGDH